jgi:hypothetical protein
MFYRQIQKLCTANKTGAKGTTTALKTNLRNILSKEQIAALEVLTKEELDALKKKNKGLPVDSVRVVVVEWLQVDHKLLAGTRSIVCGMSVGVMKDKKLKVRNLQASHTLGCTGNWNT